MNLDFIKENFEALRPNVPKDVCLVAVSKTHPAEYIQYSYDLGQRDFGENKVQELCDKAEQLPKDINWHLIGHLQRNKVKYIAPFVHLIHSVDSEKLLKEIDKEAKKNERVIDCLIQVHIAEEESKFGFDVAKGEIFLTQENVEEKYPNIRIKGLMGMATFTENTSQVKAEFDTLKTLFDKIKSSKKYSPHFDILSMGMSGDYEIAINCGSNMIRVGSTLYGKRNYQ